MRTLAASGDLARAVGVERDGVPFDSVMLPQTLFRRANAVPGGELGVGMAFCRDIYRAIPNSIVVTTTSPGPSRKQTRTTGLKAFERSETASATPYRRAPQRVGPHPDRVRYVREESAIRR